MDTNNNIKIGIYVDGAQAHNTFKRLSGDLESMLKFSKGFKGVNAFSKMAVNSKLLSKSLTKNNQLASKLLKTQNALAMKGLFGQRTGPTAMDRLIADSKRTQASLTSGKSIGVGHDIPIMNANLAKQERTWDKLNNQTYEFNGNMLSIMFAGMALSKVFNGALKSIFEGYKKVIPEAHMFNMSTEKLSASWTFFKFVLADIVGSSPIFNWLLSGIADVVDAFSQMPDWGKWGVMGTLAIGAVVGFLLMFVGMTALGVSSIGNILIGLGFMKAGAMTAFATSPVWAFIVALGGVIIVIGAIIAAFFIMRKMINTFIVEDGEEISGFWKNLYAIAVTFISGLANLFIQGIASIIEVFLLLGSGVAAIFTGVINSAFNFGKAIASAVIAGIQGKDWKSAFIDTFDFDGIADNVSKVFETGLGNAFAVKDYADEIGDSINNWNKDIIDDLSTPIKDYTEEITNAQNKIDALNAGLPDVSSTIGTNAVVNQDVNINYYGDEGMTSIKGTGNTLKSSVEDELSILGITSPFTTKS